MMKGGKNDNKQREKNYLTIKSRKQYTQFRCWIKTKIKCEIKRHQKKKILQKKRRQKKFATKTQKKNFLQSGFCCNSQVQNSFLIFVLFPEGFFFSFHLLSFRF